MGNHPFTPGRRRIEHTFSDFDAGNCQVHSFGIYNVNMKALLSSLIMLVPLVCLAENPVEVGNVTWTRHFNAALEQSRTSGKPVFVLFQEVPGCAGCQKFGREVLTEPLLVEAIESEFVPVLVYNNQGGEDAKLLKRYNEPAWNYQVIRFLDPSGKDIIPRKDRVWTLGPLASRMVAALEKAGRPVPKYLETLAAGSSASVQEAAFAMYCFWTGELKLGKIEGVVATEAGWLDGREVTRVRYNSAQITFPELVQTAASYRCADKVYASTAAQRKSLGKTRLKTGELTSDYRPASLNDQKKQIPGTVFASLPMNDMQATKVNAWARTDPKKAREWLSPRQLQQLGAAR